MRNEPVVRIVDALAETEGVDPRELDLRLQDHIDTDAIRRLAATQSGDWTLSFELPEHAVTLQGDGRVTVVRRQRAV